MYFLMDSPEAAANHLPGYFVKGCISIKQPFI